MHALHLFSVKKPLHRVGKYFSTLKWKKNAESRLYFFFFFTLITGLSFGECHNLVLAEVI